MPLFPSGYSERSRPIEARHRHAGALYGAGALLAHAALAFAVAWFASAHPALEIERDSVPVNLVAGASLGSARATAAAADASRGSERRADVPPRVRTRAAKPLAAPANTVLALAPPSAPAAIESSADRAPESLATQTGAGANSDSGAGRDADGGARGGSTWFASDDVDRVARPLRPIRPRYPASERRRGAESSVLLEAWVDATGAVARAEVLRSGGDAFDRAAAVALETAPFAPAERGGASVASRVAMNVHFTLTR